MILRNAAPAGGAKMVAHIGTHKTGSTTIQTTLDHYRRALSRHGILYPQAMTRWKGHHPLAWALGISHPERNTEVTADQAVNAVREEFAVSGANTLVLSSEDFCFLQDPAVLREAFEDFDVSVVVYLRRQDSFLRADHNQNVRMYERRFTGDIAAFLEAFDLRDRFDYERLLLPWEMTFGAHAVHVRPFEVAIQGNIAADLLQTAGLPTPDIVLGEADQAHNVSLDPRCTATLRHLNELTIDQEGHARIVRRLTDATREGVLSQEFGEEVTAADAEAVMRFVNQFRESNQRLCERHPPLAVEQSLGGIDYEGRSWDVREEEIPLEQLHRRLLQWSLSRQ